ncbi:hypothetical protein ACNF49_32410 [Actinomadura sp. ATCC 39365]
MRDVAVEQRGDVPGLGGDLVEETFPGGVGELFDADDGVVLVLGDGGEPAGADGDRPDLAGLGVGAALAQQGLVERGVLQGLDPRLAPPGGGEAGAGALRGKAANPRTAVI